MKKTCIICGAEYSAPPSAKRVTCARPECVRARKQKAHQGKHNQWSAESRAHLAQRGQTPNLRLGTPAAQESPLAGPYETNQEAKVWWLVTPWGDRYQVRNLALWCREHDDLFAADGGWERGYAGLRQVQSWLMGHRGRRVSQWKGWRLERPAEAPS